MNQYHIINDTNEKKINPHYESKKGLVLKTELNFNSACSRKCKKKVVEARDIVSSITASRFQIKVTQILKLKYIKMCRLSQSSVDIVYICFCIANRGRNRDQVQQMRLPGHAPLSIE